MLIRDIITEVARVKMGIDPWGSQGAEVKTSGKSEKTVQLPVNRIRVHEPDTKMDSLADSGFVVNDEEYWYVTTLGEKYLQKSFK